MRGEQKLGGWNPMSLKHQARARARLERLVALRRAGLTQAEIARAWRVTRARIGQLLRRAERLGLIVPDRTDGGTVQSP